MTKQKFDAYVKVQKSGRTNMFAVNVVSSLSGLTKTEIIDIMTNYNKYHNSYAGQ